jgi:hypothetical protein
MFPEKQTAKARVGFAHLFVAYLDPGFLLAVVQFVKPLTFGASYLF